MKKHKIILVLNGELPKKDHLISKVEKYDKILCADGAANVLINYGINPDFILGDLDSVHKDTLKNFKGNVINLPDQNLNDLEKILLWIINEKIKNIDIIGMDGKRIDHTIGNFSVILKYIKVMKINIFTQSGNFYTINISKIFNNIKNNYISIFSNDLNTLISSDGLKFELKNKNLPELNSGTLNYAIKNKVTINSNDSILLFVSNEKYKDS